MEKLSVFVSRPNDLTSVQRATWESVENFLRHRSLMPRIIGSTDFPNGPPLEAVVQVMRRCHGAIILGFRQMLVRDGAYKFSTEKEQVATGVYLPTPWNQIEAGIAYQLGLPLLIVKEEGISGGVFDIGSTGGYIHQFDFSSGDWIDDDRFIQPFTEWYAQALRRSRTE